MNDPEILAAALRWHTVHTKRLAIGAENARRLKAERADYRDGQRRWPCWKPTIAFMDLRALAVADRPPPMRLTRL